MKKQAILALFLSVTLFAPAQENCTVIETNKPKEIFSLLNEFIKEGSDRDVYVDRFISHNLNSVVVLDSLAMKSIDEFSDSEGQGALLGRANYNKVPTGISKFYSYRTQIILHEKIFQNDYLVRDVFFHELGHMLGLPHNSDSEAKAHPFRMMNKSTPVNIILASPPNKESWKKTLDVFWDKVSRSNKASWMRARRNDNG